MRTAPPFHQFLCYLLLVLGVGAVPSHPAVAQSNGDGSFYSRFGLGTLETFSSSQSQALGGGAYAIRSLNYNASENPALWSDQVFTRFAGGATFRQVNATGPEGRTSNLSSGSIEALQFSFPILERSLGFGIAFQPFATSNYRVVRRDDANLGQGAPVPVRIDFQGSGGFQTVRAGLGYRINDALSVGATADAIFGIREDIRQTSLQEGITAPFRSTTASDETRLTGFTGTVGVHLSLPEVFAENDVLSLGASATLPTTLDGNRVRVIEREADRDTVQNLDGEASIPWRGRIGLAYQPDDRWTFVVDGLYEPWSSFSNSLNSSAFDRQFPVGGASTLTDRWRLSIGAELVPGGESPVADFFDRTAYRLGGYTERMYIRPDTETDVRIIGGTAGISFPTPAAGTRIDFNLEAGIRGFGDAPVEDTFFGLSFHVNFGERWFQERKFR